MWAWRRHQKLAGLLISVRLVAVCEVLYMQSWWQQWHTVVFCMTQAKRLHTVFYIYRIDLSVWRPASKKAKSLKAFEIALLWVSCLYLCLAHWNRLNQIWSIPKNIYAIKVKVSSRTHLLICPYCKNCLHLKLGDLFFQHLPLGNLSGRSG